MMTKAEKAMSLDGEVLEKFLENNADELVDFDPYKEIHYQSKNRYVMVRMKDDSYLYVMNLSNIKWGGRYAIGVCSKEGRMIIPSVEGVRKKEKEFKLEFSKEK